MKHFLIFPLLILSACITTRSAHNNQFAYNSKTISRKGKHKNICKELKGNTIVYCVFVDEKNAAFWNNFDIKESKKSIETAINWIKKESIYNDVDLNIKPIYHSLKDTIHTIPKNLPYASVNNHLAFGMSKLDKWSNGIAKLVNADLVKSHKEIQKEIKGRDGLISNLQMIYRKHNIVLLYLLNNSIREETSVTLYNTESSSNDNTSEYCIISESRKPTIIAHEILHIFGADDFYHTTYSRVKLSKDIKKKYKLEGKYASFPTATNNKTNILREYPNAIMRNINLDILDSLSVSPITQYLIGWKTKYNISTRDKELMLYGDYVEID